jgi:hypothetical protein
MQQVEVKGGGPLHVGSVDAIVWLSFMALAVFLFFAVVILPVIVDRIVSWLLPLLAHALR